MKRTRYYLKFGNQTSTFGVNPIDWYTHFSREFIKANKVNVYFDEELNKLYCYERPTKFLQKEWGQSMHSLHSADLMIDYEQEVDVKETVIKLQSDNKYSNGMNWKNVDKSSNSRLRKPSKVKKSTKLPINPRTGLRDGGS